MVVDGLAPIWRQDICNLILAQSSRMWEECANLIAIGSHSYQTTIYHCTFSRYNVDNPIVSCYFINGPMFLFSASTMYCMTRHFACHATCKSNRILQVGDTLNLINMSVLNMALRTRFPVSTAIFPCRHTQLEAFPETTLSEILVWIQCSWPVLWGQLHQHTQNKYATNCMFCVFWGKLKCADFLYLSLIWSKQNVLLDRVIKELPLGV